RGQPLGEGADNRQAIGTGRHSLQLVCHAGEDDQAFEVVVAVLAAARHMQRKIDLGRRQLDIGQRHYSVSLASVRPSASLRAVRSLTLPSSSTEAATFHWNLASSSRPAFQ